MEQKILNPQPTEKNPYVVENYPWGFKKCKARFWIESVKRRGDRFVKQTQNPKTGLWCKPKKSTYSNVIIAYINENNHLKGYYFSSGADKESYDKFINFIGNLKLNEIQENELRTIRAYIKAYENVSFECVEMTGKSEEERAKHEEEQKKIQSHINKSVAVNYANDTGSL